jgi:Tfp pilus assembly protein PilO
MTWRVEWTRRARLLAACLVMGAIAAALWQMVLAPARARNAVLRQRVEEQGTNARRKGVMARTVTLRAFGVGAMERLARYYRARLDRGASPSVLLAALTEIARLERVEIIQFTPRETTTPQQETAVDVVLEGGYHDVARLIDAIGTPPSVAVLSNIRVSALTRPGARGSVAVTLVASILPGGLEHELLSHVSDGGEDGEAQLEALRYDDGGRRDPFGSLTQTVRAAATSPAAARAGLGGVRADEVMVKGVVRHGSQMLAILETPARRSFVVRPEDRLSDSSVVQIDADGVVFARIGADGETTRVRKPLFRAAREW